MPVPLIPCRHRESGDIREIPETALYLFGDWEPIEQTDDAGPTAISDTPSPPSGELAQNATPKQQAGTGRTSKAATSAKKTEEH